MKRRGMLRLLGLGAMAAPALPLTLAKAGEPATRAAQTVQRARIDTFVTKQKPLARVGEVVRVEWLDGGIGRIQGVVERVTTSGIRPVEAAVEIRVIEKTAASVRDLTHATKAVEVWVETMLELVAK